MGIFRQLSNGGEGACDRIVVEVRPSILCPALESTEWPRDSHALNRAAVGKRNEFQTVELVPMPRTMKKEDMKRKPPLGEHMRTFLVECPVHGQRYFQELGHHISTIPKKRT
jgi:hypothetical protein